MPLITDPADPRVEPYRLLRERDLVGRQGRFVIEGEVVLRAFAAAGRHRLDSLLLAEKRVAGLAPILADLPPDAPVHVASQAVLDSIVGFHIHRGILAIGTRAADLDADALLAGLGPTARVVALFGVSNHDNVGGIFRNAAAFGAEAVLLDAACCDPLYRKSIRVSVGAALSVPFARLPEGPEAVALLQRHGFTCLALSPAGAEPLHALAPPARAALLLGAEGPGLPDAVMAMARTVSIPMAGRFDSLNVATASGIALHQLAFG